MSPEEAREADAADWAAGLARGLGMPVAAAATHAARRRGVDFRAVRDRLGQGVGVATGWYQREASRLRPTRRWTRANDEATDDTGTGE